MSSKELSEKVLKGSQQAVNELIKRKQKEGGYIIVSENGKVVRKKATDIKI